MVRESLRIVALRVTGPVTRIAGLIVRHLVDEQDVGGEVLDARCGALEAGMIGAAQVFSTHILDVVGHHPHGLSLRRCGALAGSAAKQEANHAKK
jgi:hypothetical protein